MFLGLLGKLSLSLDVLDSLSSNDDNPRSGDSHRAKSNSDNNNDVRRNPFRSHSPPIHGTASTIQVSQSSHPWYS